MHALLKFNGDAAVCQVWSHPELHPALSAVSPKPDAVWSLGANVDRLPETEPIAGRARSKQTHALGLHFARKHAHRECWIFAHALFSLRGAVMRKGHYAQCAVF